MVTTARAIFGYSRLFSERRRSNKVARLDRNNHPDAGTGTGVMNMVTVNALVPTGMPVPLGNTDAFVPPMMTV